MIFLTATLVGGFFGLTACLTHLLGRHMAK
jgi:hypothetical protein